MKLEVVVPDALVGSVVSMISKMFDREHQDDAVIRRPGSCLRAGEVGEAAL